MSRFDDETRVVSLERSPNRADASPSFQGQVHPAWNIGNNPNGGYLLALAATAVR